MVVEEPLSHDDDGTPHGVSESESVVSTVVPAVPEPVRTPDIGRTVPKPVLPSRISIISAGTVGISMTACREISCLLTFGLGVVQATGVPDGP